MRGESPSSLRHPSWPEIDESNRRARFSRQLVRREGDRRDDPCADRSARLPIITMTGGILADTEDGLDDLRMSMAFGATRTIGKPFRATKFLKLVRDCLAAGEDAGLSPGITE